jgi:hypothetical protein
MVSPFSTTPQLGLCAVPKLVVLPHGNAPRSPRTGATAGDSLGMPSMHNNLSICQATRQLLLLVLVRGTDWASRGIHEPIFERLY